MGNWDELFDRFRDVQSRRGEVAQKALEVDRVRREFEDWVVAIVPRAMSDIRRHAETRAAQFKKETSVEVGIGGPEQTARTDRRAPWLAYLTLSLENTLVHVYATRGADARLYLHMMPDDATWVRKNQRVVSQSGCFIVRNHDGYELHYLRGDPAGSTDQVMPIDTLIYRAFELLTDANAQRGIQSPP